MENIGVGIQGIWLRCANIQLQFVCNKRTTQLFDHHAIYCTLYSFFHASNSSRNTVPSSVSLTSIRWALPKERRAFKARSVSLVAQSPLLVVGKRSSTIPSWSSIISSNIAIWPLTLQNKPNKPISSDCLLPHPSVLIHHLCQPSYTWLKDNVNQANINSCFIT